jgi:hypothetical protein
MCNLHLCFCACTHQGEVMGNTAMMKAFLKSVTMLVPWPLDCLSPELGDIKGLLKPSNHFHFIVTDWIVWTMHILSSKCPYVYISLIKAQHRKRNPLEMDTKMDPTREEMYPAHPSTPLTWCGLILGTCIHLSPRIGFPCFFSNCLLLPWQPAGQIWQERPAE